MKLLSLTLAALLLTGCASYEYQRHSDGSCAVSITSMRDPSSSTLAIADCDVAGASEFERTAAVILEIIRALSDK